MTPRAESVVLANLDVVGVAGLERRPASLVFVHGMWGGAWVWEHWLPFFAARGWDGYAINLRGRAGSRPVADIGRVPLADYIEDVAAVARQLGDVVVVGHMVPLGPRWQQVARDVAAWLAALTEQGPHDMPRVAQSSRPRHESAMLST